MSLRTFVVSVGRNRSLKKLPSDDSFAMSLRDACRVTLEVEVSNVSTHCFWLLLGDEELAVAYADFPWFKKATIEQLSDVHRPSEDHLYWPQLDVDLSVESIRMPEAFPLVSGVASSGVQAPRLNSHPRR